MKKFLIFLGGFVAGILATILVAYFISVTNKPTENGLLGLTLFQEKGECITTTSKKKSCEIEVFQVLAPNAALGNIKYYSDENFGGQTFRNYDIQNDVVVLLINYDNKTYYDNQKIDITNKCARQIGTYQYKTKSEFEKTVPAIVIE